MHDDVTSAVNDSDWAPYIERLTTIGALRGGSAIGEGRCLRKSGSARDVSTTVTGYLKLWAASIDEGADLLAGNPVFEAGGSVEIRELPVTR
jgi:hypothetical protein